MEIYIRGLYFASQWKLTHHCQIIDLILSKIQFSHFGSNDLFAASPFLLQKCTWQLCWTACPSEYMLLCHDPTLLHRWFLPRSTSSLSFFSVLHSSWRLNWNTLTQSYCYIQIFTATYISTLCFYIPSVRLCIPAHLIHLWWYIAWCITGA